jgi:hypothetical protein
MTSVMRAFTAAAVMLAAGPTLPTCFNVYHADVERICDAEHRSGITLKADPGGVEAWLRRSVASPEGVVLLNQLQSESLRDRVIHLRGEARNQSIAACPFADSLDVVANDAAYKAAIVSLCTGEATNDQGDVARLDVTSADDAERMREITDWTALNLKSPQAQNVVARMAQAAVKDRSGILKAEASKVGLTSCALATTLDQPPPPSANPKFVSLPSFVVASFDTPIKLQRPMTDVITGGPTSQMINDCYGPALAKTPALEGNVALHLTIDGKGKVSKAENGASTLPNAGVIHCIQNGITGVTLVTTEPKPDKPFPGVKCTLNLALAPLRGSPPPGWPNFPAGTPGAGGAPDAGATADAGALDAGKKKKGH